MDGTSSSTGFQCLTRQGSALVIAFCAASMKADDGLSVACTVVGERLNGLRQYRAAAEGRWAESRSGK